MEIRLYLFVLLSGMLLSCVLRNGMVCLAHRTPTKSSVPISRRLPTWISRYATLCASPEDTAPSPDVVSDDAGDASHACSFVGYSPPLDPEKLLLRPSLLLLPLRLLMCCSSAAGQCTNGAMWQNTASAANRNQSIGRFMPSCMWDAGSAIRLYPLL